MHTTPSSLNPCRNSLFLAAMTQGCILAGRQRWAKTQDLTILDQLSVGVRYFDLRPGWARIA